MAVAVKQKVRFGPYELDVHSGELWKNGIRLKLQPQPIQILAALLERPGELVTREELQHRLWLNDTFVDFEQGLNTAVKKLRVALCDEAETPKYIETLPKRGYRFVGEILQETQETQAEPTISPPLLVEPQSSSSTAKRSRKALWIAVVAALVIIAILIKVTYREFFPLTPRIVWTRQLTHTGLKKSYSQIATDGTRVYFVEQRTAVRQVLAQVSVEGGDVSDVPAHFKQAILLIGGMSPSGSDLLVSECCSAGWTSWIQPIPAGPMRRSPIPVGSPGRWGWDGSFLYHSSENDENDLYRMDRDGSNPRRLFMGRFVRRPNLSPDGKRVRFHMRRPASKSRYLMEVGIDGSNPHPIYPQKRGESILPGWTVDGKLFYFVGINGPSVTLWGVREPRFRLPFLRSEPTLLYAGPLALMNPVGSRNNKELYAVGQDRRGELSLYDERFSNFVPYLGGISASYVTFSPDHQWIAYVAYPEGTLWKSRTDGSDRLQLTFPPMGVLLPRWSPDGKFIVFVDWFGSEHSAIYLVPAEGGQPKLLLTGPFEPSDPTWSPDSRYIAYAGEPAHTRVEILDLSTMVSTEVPGSEGFFSPRWSPDGKYIVAINTASDQQPRLYSFEQKRWRSIKSGMTGVGWPAWSHDSKFIYVSGDSRITRINLANDKSETVVNTERVRWTSFALDFAGWFDLTPDDRVMILRDTGSEEIYALELEY